MLTWRSFTQTEASTYQVPAMRSSSTLARLTREPYGSILFDGEGD
jgi:hypothetical protein